MPTSRVVQVKRAISLNDRHNTDNEDEVKRIRAVGEWRVH